jgi:hypothetical protein
MADQVSNEVVRLMVGKLVEIWHDKNHANTLYLAIDDYRLPDDFLINGLKSPGYVIESGWYIWDNSSATEILTADDIEDYFGDDPEMMAAINQEK